jgi:hypothetical protein
MNMSQRLVGGSLVVVIGALVLIQIAGYASSPWVGSLALVLIALSSLALYLWDRSRSWALLGTYSFAVLSLAPLMSITGLQTTYFAPILLIAIALPLFIAYACVIVPWWALIPAGALVTIGLVVALATAGFAQWPGTRGTLIAVLISGLAVTFGAVGWRHAQAWAKVATVVLVILAVAAAVVIR